MSSQIERAVLASVLYDPDVVIAAKERGITPEMFHVPQHRQVFEAMYDLAERRITPDILSVGDELTRQGLDDHTLFLSELYSEAVMPVSYASYLEQLIAHHRAHLARKAAARVIEEVGRNPLCDIERLVSEVFNDIAAGQIDNGPKPFAAYADQIRTRLEAQKAGTWQENVVPTGLPTLDKRLNGGLRGGDLVVLAARPSMGKSALALKIAREASAINPALLFSLEMTGSSIYERAVADMAGVSLDVLRSRKLPDTHYHLLRKVNETMANVPVWVDDTAGLTTEQAATRATRFKAEHGLSVVVCDYLQIMGDAKGRNENDQYRVSRMSQAMKQLAMALDVPVLMLSQLNRAVEQRRPAIPHLADLRDSGSIEQDADIVLMLYRHDYYVERGMAKDDPAKVGTCDVLIQKQRNGATGTVPLRFIPHSMTFEDPTVPTYAAGAAD